MSETPLDLLRRMVAEMTALEAGAIEKEGRRDEHIRGAMPELFVAAVMRNRQAPKQAVPPPAWLGCIERMYSRAGGCQVVLRTVESAKSFDQVGMKLQASWEENGANRRPGVLKVVDVDQGAGLLQLEGCIPALACNDYLFLWSEG